MHLTLAPRSFPALSIVLLAVAPPVRAQGSTFTGLPEVANAYFAPASVSADGTSVVGMMYIAGTGDRGRRWQLGVGFDDPGDPVNQGIASWCTGISDDGQAIVGGSGHAVFGDLEAWFRDGNSVGGVGSPSGHDTSDLRAVSRDGQVAVGYGGFQSNPNMFEAAWYTQQNDWELLGFLPGGDDSVATATSGDGAVIAGWSTASGNKTPAFRWTQATGMVSLGNLPGGVWAQPRGVSAAGDVVVGFDEVSNVYRAWRWTSATGMTTLGSLPGGGDSLALATSDDGDVVVGMAVASNGNWRAFVWDAAHGMRDLKAALLASGATDATGWTLEDAADVRGNGPFWITGYGYKGSQDSGYVAYLDEGSACQVASYCTTSPNSAGAGTLMQSFGSTSISANDFAVGTVGNPVHQFGLFFMGPAQTSTPLGDGTLCVSGQLVRYGAQLTDGAGASYRAIDNTIPPASGHLTVGSTWNWQWWYRDQPAGGAGYNLSDALTVTFCP